MRFYGDVIARKGKKYWIGRIKRGKFYPNEELNSLKTLDKLQTKYLTLAEYAMVIGQDLTVKEMDVVRKKTGYTEIWVIDKPPPKTTKTGDLSNTVWERWYFRFLNPLCQKCVKDCKQSSRAQIFCPQFKEKK